MLLPSSLSKSSISSYKRVFGLYVNFIHDNIDKNLWALPPNVQHMSLFLAHCYQLGLAATTTQTYVSALGFIFKLGNFHDVSQHFIIQKMLQGYKKVRSTTDARLPITPTI